MLSLPTNTTNFIVGRCTASAIASASRKSFFCPLEYGRRAKRKPTGSLDCLRLLSARARHHSPVDEGGQRGGAKLFYRAIELDPGFASAYGMAAWCRVQRNAGGWMQDRAREVAETERLARRRRSWASTTRSRLASQGSHWHRSPSLPSATAARLSFAGTGLNRYSGRPRPIIFNDVF